MGDRQGNSRADIYWTAGIVGLLLVLLLGLVLYLGMRHPPGPNGPGRLDDPKRHAAAPEPSLARILQASMLPARTYRPLSY